MCQGWQSSMTKAKNFKNRGQYFLLLIIIAGIGLSGYNLVRYIKNELTVAIVQPQKPAIRPAPPTTLSIAPTPVERPWRLRITAIGVDANIQYVGLTSGGNMAAPTNNTDVAWYKPGTLPGEPGNAVMAGHLDFGGKPAVFWNLNKLQAGDLVEVINSNNHATPFKVIGSIRYDTVTAPLKQIFGPSGQAHLNLITCDGAWDKNQRVYNQRLVVFTQAT